MNKEKLDKAESSVKESLASSNKFAFSSRKDDSMMKPSVINDIRMSSNVGRNSPSIKFRNYWNSNVDGDTSPRKVSNANNSKQPNGKKITIQNEDEDDVDTNNSPDAGGQEVNQRDTIHLQFHSPTNNLNKRKISDNMESFFMKRTESGSAFNDDQQLKKHDYNPLFEEK
jgi:hypothetical protein